MSKRTLEQSETDVEAAIASQQRRMQCLTPTTMRAASSNTRTQLREFGDALVLRE